MGIVSNRRLAAKTAKHANGKHVAWGVDFARTKIKGGKGLPAVDLNLWGVRGSLEMRGYQRELRATETARGFEFNLANPGRLVIEERESLTFPGGEIWTPEHGILTANLVIDAPGETSWPFDLSLPGCAWVYQGPLTPQDIDEGCVRPAWAVGSWVIYDATGLKIGHMSRPFATDADGAQTWGTIDVDAAGLVTVTMPAAWMAAARYPVTVDPDIGRTTAGATALVLNNGNLRIWAVGGGSGVATAVHFYCDSTSGSGRPVTLGIYTFDGTLRKDTAASTSPVVGAAAWMEVALDSNLALTNGALYCASINNDTGQLNCYFDTGGCMGMYSTAASAYSAGALPDPAPTMTISSTLRNFSVHIAANDPVYPAAADVQSGAAAYGPSGTEYTPSYATTAATNAAHQAADLAFLNTNKDEMIAANDSIQAQYGCDAGTGGGGGRPEIRGANL